MAKGSPEEEDDQAPSKPRHTSKRKVEDESQPDSLKHKSRRSSKRRTRSRRNYSDGDDSYSSSSYDSDSYSDSESDRSEHSSEDSGSETEEERKRRKSRERKKREEREKEKRRRRRREKEKMKKRKKRDRDDEADKKEKKTKKHKKKEDKGRIGAVTNSWGKYGIIKDSDMWNKRPEFTAWLLEVKQVNLESLPNWEEKQMFKQFMEDHNTATFPSKKYYNLDAYHRNKLEKQMKKGIKKVVGSERIIFDDEEQRRLELQRAREKQKEVEIEALKRSMQTGMAQAMKDQARLKEEMAYQYKLGNMEAAAAIQRRLDPDVPS